MRRSQYALVCGLFVGRWVLAAVGKCEFRLHGVVGGMTVIALAVFAVRLLRIYPEAVVRAAKRSLEGCGIAVELNM